MKLSERWLREWVNPQVDSKKLAADLSMAGLEIEALTAVAPPLLGVKVAHVLEVAKHPNADRLSVCVVDSGTEKLTIVCGAKNVRAGLKTPLATIGTKLPNGLNIKQAKVRDIESFGMLCSEVELGLAENSDGIIELAEDAPVGQELSDYLQLDDYILDVNITPNRGDCLSILGTAREVAAIYKSIITSPFDIRFQNKAHIKNPVPVQVKATEQCRRYVTRIIQNINPHAKTPAWLQEKLRRSGLRSIHPVVDVTNYVMLELGQPMHAFDLNKINKGIQVRLAHDQEQLKLLDDRTITLKPDMLIIADATKPLALAGIMGGSESGVTENTNAILLESAFFDPIAVTRSARYLQIFSDSSMRFERGVDPQLQIIALERATSLLLEIVGGEASDIIEYADPSLSKEVEITLRKDRIKKILGTEIDAEEVAVILTSLGMQIVGASEHWKVRVPSWRFDITQEIDLIEELARIYGYERIKPIAFSQKTIISKTSEEKRSLSAIRKLLVDLGYQETINYSFVDPELLKLVDPQHSPLKLKNPISSDMSAMRTTLWAGLLNTALFNLNRKQERIRLFETGLCFIENSLGEIQQIERIGGLITGPLSSEQWALSSKLVDFYDLKGDIENLISASSDREISFLKAEMTSLHPGQSAFILLNGKNIGKIGRLSPILEKKLEFINPVFLFELDLQAVQAIKLPRFEVPSKFPAIRRDIAIVVKEQVPFEDIQVKIRESSGSLLHQVQLFDIYRGEGIDSGEKSIALGLIFQDKARTLVDNEVDQIIEKILNNLKESFNATLRM